MTTIQNGCRDCGGTMYARRSAEGARDLHCNGCGARVQVTPEFQVWPFSAAVAPAAVA